MYDRKIFSPLSQLDSGQIERWKGFMHSPYFNQHEKLSLLCDYLTARYPDFEGIEDAQLFNHLHPGEAFNKKRLNYYFGLLNDLFVRFMAIEYYQQDALQQQQDALLHLLAKDSPARFTQSLLNKQEKQLRKQPYQSGNFYRQNYQLQASKDLLQLKAAPRGNDPSLQLKNDYFDQYYIYEKLKIACDMTSRNIVTNSHYQCHLLEELAVILYKYPQFLEIPGIQIYHQILKMLQDPSEENYYTLKNILTQFGAQMEQKELVLMYDYIQNFCIRKINSGELEYYAEFLDLYKHQLKEQILFRNGILEERDYMNIVTAGVRTGDYLWTEQFIQQNKKRLRPEIRENAYTYNLANFYYETARYTEALQQLHQVEFKDPTYHLGAKVIQLKSYYELSELAVFDSLIQAFKAYIRRSKELSVYRRKAYSHFLRVAQKLGRIKEERDYLREAPLQKKLAKAQQLIKELYPLASSEWLGEALGSLKS